MFIMASQITNNAWKFADIVVFCLEGSLVVYILVRMLENILLDLGYASLNTEGLAIVLYLVLSAQVCMLLSWPWSTPPEGRPSGSRIYTALVLGCLLLAEACLAVCGLVLAWTELLWDVVAVTTLQAVLSAGLFIAYDRRRGKVNHVQPVVEFLDVPPLRRRRPGG